MISEAVTRVKCREFLFLRSAFRGKHEGVLKICDRRFLATQCDSLSYSEHGDPRKVLRRVTSILPTKLKDGEAMIRMLAAPINPADINMIQGVYPVRPELPAVGGNEGVGEIVEIGSSIRNLQPGDWVIPNFSGWGTWKTFAVCPAGELIKIPNDIPLPTAATVQVNPCTAYRMLTDFVKLSSGDVVIQNGANSGVGQAVIQIAAKLSLKTINIVRNRPNFDGLVTSLKDLGATHVVTDEFIRTPEMKTLMATLPKPKLGLNCVGGKSVADLLKYLDRSATLVTYGGMSKQPLMIPTGALIFNDVKVLGYWMTQWSKENMETAKMKEMWQFIGDMARCGQLRSPLHRLVKFDDFSDAIAKAMEPLTSEKQILVMNSIHNKK